MFFFLVVWLFGCGFFLPGFQSSKHLPALPRVPVLMQDADPLSRSAQLLLLLGASFVSVPSLPGLPAFTQPHVPAAAVCSLSTPVHDAALPPRSVSVHAFEPDCYGELAEPMGRADLLLSSKPASGFCVARAIPRGDCQVRWDILQKSHWGTT